MSELTAGRDEVEVAHEALIRHWPRLRGWLDADRAGLLLREGIREAAQDWERSGRDESYLEHRGRRLEDAEALARQPRFALNADERAYLDAGLALRERTLARQRRARLAVVAASLAVALVASVLAGWAWWERGRAEEQRATAIAESTRADAARVEAEAQATRADAERRNAEQRAREARVAFSGQLAIRSRAESETHPERGLLLAVEALNVTARDGDPPLPMAQSALHDALARVGGRVLRGDAGPIVAAAISPDGKWAATIAESGEGQRTATLWNLTAADRATRLGLVPEGSGGGGSAVAPLPPRTPNSLQGSSDFAFSPDAHWLVIGARLWDLTAPDPAAARTDLVGVEGTVDAIAISPDSRWLVAGSLAANTVLLWDLSGSGPSASPQRLAGHTEPTVGFAFSPDSHWLATATGLPDGNREFGSGDTTVFLWNLAAPQPAAARYDLLGHTGSVTTLVFSPDGQWLATANGGYDSHTFEFEDTARLWDLTAPDPAADPISLTGHHGPITSVAFSPDRRLVAIGSWNDWTGDRSLTRVWDLAGDRSQPVLEFEGATVFAAFSPDGTRLITVEGGETVVGDSQPRIARLWQLNAEEDAATERSQPLLDGGLPLQFNEFALSDDHRWLVTDGPDPITRLWDLASDTPRLLRGHEGDLTAASFSPDNRWVITGSGDGSARLWNLAVAENSASPIVVPGELFVISDDSRWLATIGEAEGTGGTDSAVLLWDLTADPVGAPPIILRGPEGPTFSVAISHDGRWLATGTYAGSSYLWDLAAADPAASAIPLSGHESPVDEVAFTPDGRWLVTASFDGTARLWDLTAADRFSAKHVLVGGSEPIFGLLISPDAHWLITRATGAAGVRLWDLTSSDPGGGAIVLERGVADSAAAFSPDGHWLVTSATSEDRVREMHLWDLTEIGQTAAPITLTGAHEPFVVSDDGHWLITAGADNDAMGWDLTSGADPVPSFVLTGQAGAIAALAVSADSHWLATASYDETVRLWDLSAANPAETGRLLTGQTGPVTEVVFSPDRRRLVTASRWGGGAMVLDPVAADPAVSAIALTAAGETVSDLAFSPNGQWLVTRDYESKTVRLWETDLARLEELACRTAGRNLTREEWGQFVGDGAPYQQTCPNLPPDTSRPPEAGASAAIPPTTASPPPAGDQSPPPSAIATDGSEP